MQLHHPSPATLHHISRSITQQPGGDPALSAEKIPNEIKSVAKSESESKFIESLLGGGRVNSFL